MWGDAVLHTIKLSPHIYKFILLFVVVCREEARNMWRSQEERWRREHALRKTGIDNLFSAIKTQVCMHYLTFRLS